MLGHLRGPDPILPVRMSQPGPLVTRPAIEARREEGDRSDLLPVE
jgi:hypothetical protein